MDKSVQQYVAVALLLYLVACCRIVNGGYSTPQKNWTTTFFLAVNVAGDVGVPVQYVHTGFYTSPEPHVLSHHSKSKQIILLPYPFIINLFSTFVFDHVKRST